MMDAMKKSIKKDVEERIAIEEKALSLVKDRPGFKEMSGDEHEAYKKWED